MASKPEVKTARRMTCVTINSTGLVSHYRVSVWSRLLLNLLMDH